ncbi:MAG: magnesium transporter CorA family protein [Patescibacteria group bacterium]|jgi:magnesium transporter|nr:magnesium transporter CorA family protein [Patescibacteria group bacterium]
MKQEINSKINWIDILSPSQEDLKFLKDKFKLHPILLEELKQPSTRSKIEIYDNLMFIVYYFSNYNENEKTSEAVEVDFLITRDYLITVRYKNYEPIDEIFAELKKELSNQYLNQTPAHLLYYILENGLIFSLRQLTHIQEKIKQIECELFRGEHKSLIEKIAIVKRDILDQRIIARLQHPILESLKLKGLNFFGKNLEIYFNDLLGDYEKLWMSIDNLKETIESLENTNNTFFESRTNEIMKILTIMAFITFPLTLFSSIFSMNTENTPLVSSPYGFWYIVGLMFLFATLFLVIFKKKKWL